MSRQKLLWTLEFGVRGVHIEKSTYLGISRPIRTRF